MFPERENTVLLQPMRECDAKDSYLIRIGAKRASADNWVSRIVIDIKIGREVRVNANGSHFSSHSGCHTMNILCVCGGTNCHRRRKFCEAFVFRKARNASTLLIDGGEQSRISTFDRGLLELIRERSNLSRRLDIARK